VPPETVVQAPLVESEQAPATAEIPAPAPVTAIKLPALTVVELRVLDDVTSKTAVAGAPVRLALARPLYLTPELGIPEGTPVEGVIIHAAKGGMGGKSGELLLGARKIILSDAAIPLRSFKLGPAQGLNNETLAFATAVAVGLPALFINGGSARIQAGAIANAKTSADTEISVTLLSKLPPIPPPPAPAYSPVPPTLAPSTQPTSNQGESK
jgi:hypothetical protein